MAEIGKINTLNVVRETENGVYIDGENLEGFINKIRDDDKIDLLSTLFKLNFVPLICYIKKIGSDHLFHGMLLTINLVEIFCDPLEFLMQYVLQLFY